ncbi:MAG TPA: hypothetical protein VMU65_16245 [Candidatus Saccharimonadales bacterium]|nr:hypothetical protein [Candidatus Saccharimonadales bacterium]
MTDYQNYITQLQKQFLTAMHTIGESQAKLIEAVRAVPVGGEIKQPSTSEVVEQSYDFVIQMIDAQRDMTLRLIKATGLNPAKTGARQAA